MTDLASSLALTKKASRAFVTLSHDAIDDVLKTLADVLVDKTDDILAANQKDLDKMDPSDPKYDRLKLSRERIEDIAKDVQKVAALPSPLGITLEERTLPNGLELTKTSVPLGVVGIIYEARPNVTVDAFSLCFKSGNACVLKGGSDAEHSNEILASIIHDVLQKKKIDPNVFLLLPADRSAVEVMLHAHESIDVIIPRGSQKLIDFVRENSRVPLIETGAGIVHTYVDASADGKKAAEIIYNEKTRRPSVCNSLDTLLIHRERLGDLPSIIEPMLEQKVEIYADEESFDVLKDHYDASLLHRAEPEHFGTEFLCLKMSVKTVKDLDEAIEYINQNGSHHSEAIVSEDAASIEKFLNEVDAAAVYANASTAFSDGGQFGMGGEIGISTQKLHARGPMGLRELTSYKWIVRGNGQTRKS